ncbi:MAG TPA: DUF1624 domain-containing protein [Pararhizobium sp.]|uniref:heparan-alpha-glucosaminide N-acetyltransferase n=1 Tax=Pararhizobium sp. TaxID=1977563 RepID=UPI002CA4065D|nr:DUF1624 domain-containing protein [Pararhizobium sp.]HTO32692.1 DUF1624 domain-containing protein [Pararhizobium sp.]
MSITNAVTDNDNGTAAPATTARPGRLWVIDALRGVALIAMASYHFSWDLGFFGYIDPQMVGTGVFKMYARSIAGSFLFLAGLSLVLGHYPVIRVRSFAIRFARIAGAALVITIATWFAFPDAFIFFGILHAIAAASLIGLFFLRLPPVLTLIVAVAAFAAPLYLRSPVFEMPALWWVGLSQTLPRSNDYVPLLPWLAPFLAGIAIARIALRFGWFDKLRSDGSARWKTILATAGRHSLLIYLVHQPLLFGCVALFAQILPPETPLHASCVSACAADNSKAFCTAFCDCTVKQLADKNLLGPLNAGQIDVATDARIFTIQTQCTMEAQAKE